MTPEPARAADLDAIKALLQAAELPATDVTAVLLADFVVLRENGIAGCAGLERHGDDALLRSVAVGAPRRGGGLGGALVDAIETHAKSRGVRTLYLLTTTADKFFAARGYERIDRRQAPPSIQTTREFTTLCPSSAVCMVKPLQTLEIGVSSRRA